MFSSRAAFRLPWIWLALAGSLIAADLGGTWRFEQTMPNGRKRMTTYVFKVDGNKFTGVVGTLTDQREILNGVIDGNQITFDTRFEFDDTGRLTPFKGEITGDELKITAVNPPQGGRGGGGGRGGPPPVYKKVSNETVYVPPPENVRVHKPFPPLKALPANGLAKTPPMGWNSWNKFAGRVDDKTIREIADALVTSGMRDAGYIYLNIDDTWEAPERDKDGNIRTNEKFPDMKALADYVHSKGLKIGIYSGPGPRTCAGFLGSYGHEEQDAKTFAAWGIDYLKYDWCAASAVYHRDEHKPAYEKMGLALRATGRPIVYSLCQYGWMKVEEWGAEVGGNLWRTTGDIRDAWDSMARIGFGQNGREKYAGPGHWNDPDMLEIGNGGMTDTEYRTHMSLWSVLAAPLLAGNDVRSMTDETKAILLNKEVIAINQDKLGAQGFRVSQNGDLEVWKKPLSDGVAVALFNRGAAPAKMSVKWSEVGVTKKANKVRDLWAHADVKAADGFEGEVASHGVILLKVH